LHGNNKNYPQPRRLSPTTSSFLHQSFFRFSRLQIRETPLAPRGPSRPNVKSSCCRPACSAAWPAQLTNYPPQQTAVKTKKGGIVNQPQLPQLPQLASVKETLD